MNTADEITDLARALWPDDPPHVEAECSLGTWAAWLVSSDGEPIGDVATTHPTREAAELHLLAVLRAYGAFAHAEREIRALNPDPPNRSDP